MNKFTYEHIFGFMGLVGVALFFAFIIGMASIERNKDETALKQGFNIMYIDGQKEYIKPTK